MVIRFVTNKFGMRLRNDRIVALRSWGKAGLVHGHESEGDGTGRGLGRCRVLGFRIDTGRRGIRLDRSRRGGRRGGMLRAKDGHGEGDVGTLLSDKWRRTISDRLIPVGNAAMSRGFSTAELRSLSNEMNDIVVGPYLIGEEMSLADCAAFPSLWRIDREFGIGGDGEEGLQSWLDKCIDTDSIKRTIPDRGCWWWW